MVQKVLGVHGTVLLNHTIAVASCPGLLCLLLGMAVAVAHRLQPQRLKTFFNQSAGEDPLLNWNPEEELLSPRYRSKAESPEPQNIPLSEVSSNACCKEDLEEPDCAL